MTGDASARRYERLRNPSGDSVILMDAQPDVCGSQAQFVEISKHLVDIGLCAPKILNWDSSLGLMVLEDLGQIDFARHLQEHPDDERRLYDAAVDVLIELGRTPPLAGLQQMTPTVGAEMIDIGFEWAAIEKSPSLAEDIKSELTTLLSSVSPNPATLSLRDFHAENLIWRPNEIDNGSVGLLDFQDAFITHPTYDLASLLRDARRDVDPNLVDPLVERLGGGEEMFLAFHVMAVQRNLRILGIFERLARRDGKIGYLDLIPRVRDHLKTDLEAPCLARLAPLVQRAFKIPEGDIV
ncbi:phosphotransferase [Octadecabacter sp. CECT 8868]|uniref:aminoglycoside phosphotransferase family protein n=1 Tax=Octadecabacter algicola TaxID=2909342 RepID=UPI001F4668D3|nr:phosphotransferase [Octadecabacter algicola]MCF2906016.1 phosphotransferase [Octadecabacter algicola]